MVQNAKKGNCSTCRVCKAYLREAGRNQTKKEETFVEGEQADAPAPVERVADDRLPAGAESSGCPTRRTRE